MGVVWLLLCGQTARGHGHGEQEQKQTQTSGHSSKANRFGVGTCGVSRRHPETAAPGFGQAQPARAHAARPAEELPAQRR